MNHLLVAMLVFVTVTALGGAAVLALQGRRRAIRSRLAFGAAGVSVAGGGPVIGTLGRIGGALPGGRGSTTLRALLSSAGYHGEAAAAVYVGAKLLCLALGLAAAGALAFTFDLSVALGVYVTLFGGAILFFVPNLVVRARRTHRREEVERHLPDAIDLLEICVSSGMGLDMAWNAVADEIRGVSTVLADEMALTNLEMQLGATRAIAMRSMAERTGADEISSLVALVVQSERFGTSVADALSTFARSMRERRTQVVEERAEKMAVKLLFPLVLFIFPVMLIVIAGPAAIMLIRIIGG